MLRYYSLGRAYRTSLRNRPQKRLLGLTYGETPAFSFWQMMQWAQYRRGEVFLELGSGTGRLSLIAAQGMELESIGIDCISPFVCNGNRIAQSLGLNACRFQEGDFFTCSWSCADIVYITATACTAEQVRKMGEKCLELKNGARLISLTHPPNVDCMSTLGLRMFDFSWGPTAVYLSVRNDRSAQVDSAEP